MTNQTDEYNKKGVFPENKEGNLLEETLCKDLSEFKKIKNYNKKK